MNDKLIKEARAAISDFKDRLEKEEAQEVKKALAEKEEIERLEAEEPEEEARQNAALEAGDTDAFFRASTKLAYIQKRIAFLKKAKVKELAPETLTAFEKMRQLQEALRQEINKEDTRILTEYIQKAAPADDIIFDIEHLVDVTLNAYHPNGENYVFKPWTKTQHRLRGAINAINTGMISTNIRP